MKLIVNGQQADWASKDLTVSGSDGIYLMEIELNDAEGLPSWASLTAYAVFKSSAMLAAYPDGIAVPINGGRAEIPAAILSEPGMLYVGVYGTNGSIVMPTIWAPAFCIALGCTEGSAPGPSVLDAARQAIKYGENAEVYAEGGYLVTDVQGPIEDPVLVRSDEHTDGAKDYADAAAGSATAAEGSKDAAALSAEDAEAWAVGQRDGVDVPSDDPAYHNNARYYAGQAANSASDAHADAVAANADAQAAAGSASDASGYATAAGNAKTAAQSAQGYAEAAQTGAETAEGNAEAWSVGQRDGADVPATDPAYNNNAKYYAGQAAASAAQAAQTAASIAADFAYLTAPDGISQVGLYQDRTATPGAIVAFADGAAVPAKSASIGIEPVQDLHGQANPWPAGGGKNIIPYPYRDADGTYSGVPFSTDSVGKITASGTNNAGINYYLMGATTLPAGTYTLSATGPHEGCGLIAYNSDAGAVLANIAGSSASASASFTLAADTNIVLYFNAGASARAININCYVQLEAGATATSFTPYENICPITGWTGCDITVQDVESAPAESNIIAVDWTDEAGTVYGGTLEYLGGQMWRLTRTWYGESLAALNSVGQGFIKVDSGIFRHVLSRVYGTGKYPVKTEAYATYTEGHSTGANIATLAAEHPFNVFCNAGSDQIFIADSRYAEVADWITAMGSTLLIFQMATPPVYDLTADELATMLGKNVIFADTGDIEELTYRTSENSRTIVLGTSLSGVLEAIAGFIGVSE